MTKQAALEKKSNLTESLKCDWSKQTAYVLYHNLIFLSIFFLCMDSFVYKSLHIKKKVRCLDKLNFNMNYKIQV